MAGELTSPGAPSGPGARPPVEVRRSARRRRTVTAFRERDTIVVLVPARMSRREEQRHVDQLVERLLSREARTAAPRGDADLAVRAAELAARYLADADGTVPQAASVGWVANQRRRWGSCTPLTRTIRLSDRLQAMPTWVVDHVLLHELTHLVEAHHTPRFHALAEQLPEAERARGYLEGWDAAHRLGSPGPSTDEARTEVDGDVD